ncbi:Protein of unknown function [Klenkia marina]|uniref:DUF3071 domain-containing protein n=1 Tax=Klenkia marina TaxID=1960309 RepID=A0A1G4XDB5_9ACTN|nr:septation protein SepH [Klenkia marina]SCX38984.1 Protein of unknown function [Klenkia marina]
MRTLRLVALSDDGRSLVLAADVPDSIDNGERFYLPIDDRLKAAARGDAQRMGQIELDASHALPPRVIQARIRAGETPEQVAHASGTPVERIMRFAHPVLQERARVAEQAQAARVRLSEGTPSVPLVQFMTDRLRLLGADLDAVRWDSHRTEDGSWQVRAAWKAGHKSGTTRWSYDTTTRTVTPVDATTTDFAEGTRLVRVVPDVPAGLPSAPAPRRTIAAVPAAPPEPDWADDPAEDPVEPVADHHDDDEVRNVVPVDGSPVDVLLSGDGGPEHDTVVFDRVDPEAEDPRAAIPAWEDIVFGVRRHR